MVVFWRSGGALVSINKVILRWAGLVLGWVTVSGFKCLALDVYLSFSGLVAIFDDDVTPQCNDAVLMSVFDSVYISDTDVLWSVNKLKCNSSGSDELPPVLFKRLKHCLCKPLAIMFRQLVSVGMVPEAWHRRLHSTCFQKRDCWRCF